MKADTDSQHIRISAFKLPDWTRQPSVYICVFVTEELNLPADIPSYLSSQGTLSEPQEGYSNSEAGSHQQLMHPISNGYVHKGTDGTYSLLNQRRLQSVFLSNLLSQLCK